jgi:hypothetical protein
LVPLVLCVCLAAPNHATASVSEAVGVALCPTVASSSMAPTGQTLASLYTTTTETAEQNSGKLENNFDREKVQDEIALQIEVTQQFGANVQYAQGRFREQEKGLRDQAKAAEAAGDFAQAAKLYGEAKSWQEGEVLLNMLAGGLTAPTNSAGGILASTLAPAGGAEAIAPILSNYLYGKSPNELTPEQKWRRLGSRHMCRNPVFRIGRDFMKPAAKPYLDAPSVLS